MHDRHLGMMRTDPVSTVTARPWGARIAISAVFLACGITVGAWASQLPRIKETLGLSDATLSFVVLAFACGSIPVMPLTGALVARWGGVRTIAAASVGSAAGMLMLGLAGNFTTLLVTSLLAGSAIGMLDVSMNAHATAVELAFRRPIMSSIHGWFSLGGLIGAGCGGLLTEQAVSIAVVLGLSGATVLLAGVLGAPFLTVAEHGRGGAGFALPRRPVLAIGLLCLMAFLIEGAVVDWSGVYMRDVAQASLGVSAAGFAGFSIAMALGRFTGDAVVRRLGRVIVMMVSGCLAAAGIGLALALPYPAATTLGFLLAGMGMANVVPLLFSAAGRVPGVPPAAGVAMAATMGYGAFLTGPPLIGFLAGAIGLRLAMLVPLLCAVAIAASARR
ncbi:MAG: MFS transporter [Acetobacteraceae bacterium]